MLTSLLPTVKGVWSPLTTADVLECLSEYGQVRYSPTALARACSSLLLLYHR